MVAGVYPKEFSGAFGRSSRLFEDRIEIESWAGSKTGRRGDYDGRRWVRTRASPHIQLTRKGGGYGSSLDLPGYITEARIRGTWIGALPDADQMAMAAMARFLRQDELFGLDAQERLESVGRWRMIAWAVAAPGFGLAAAAMFSRWWDPRVLPMVWLAAAAYPALTGLAGLASGGRLWVTRKDGDLSSMPMTATGICCMVLPLLSLNIEYQPVPPALLAGAVLAAIGAVAGLLVILKSPQGRMDRRWLGSGALVGAFYGIGLLGPLDTLVELAPARPEQYVATASHVQHHTKGGDTYSADLIDPVSRTWQTVELSRGQYRHMAAYAEPVLVLFHPGGLGAPWIEAMLPGERPRPVLLLSSAPGSAAMRAGPVHIYSQADQLPPPDPTLLARSYPTRAREAGISGEATLACMVTTQGVTRDCRVVSEQPRGEGFAAAALSISPSFIFRPRLENGRPVEGTATIPVQFAP